MGKLALFFTSVLKIGLFELITALGIGFISYKGLDLALGYFKNQLLGSFNNLSTDLMQLVGLLGLGQGLAIIFGAYAALIALQQAKSFIGKLSK